MEEYIDIGTIVNTHGIKGEVKVFPNTDNKERFELLDEIFVETKEGLKAFPIVGVRYIKNLILLKLESIDSMTKAEELKTCPLKIPKDLMVPLEKDEYYIKDLYNMKVVTQEGENLGEITDVLSTGSNDVYVVKDVSNPNSKELLIPSIKECIINVDIEQNTMTVHLLEGLR